MVDGYQYFRGREKKTLNMEAVHTTKPPKNYNMNTSCFHNAFFTVQFITIKSWNVCILHVNCVIPLATTNL
jgi:hypothetical protein